MKQAGALSSLGPIPWKVLAGAVLALALSAESAVATPVTVTITRIRANDQTADSGLEALGESTADLYAIVEIDSAVKSFFDLHVDDDPDVEPFWVFSTDVAGPTAAVTIQIWDHDTSSGDDQADADPGLGKEINLTVDVIAGTWTGDTNASCLQEGTPNTEGSEGVFTCWDISTLSASGDLDGDGLLDNWESNGLDFNGDGLVDVDLPAFGADPMHKDLFLEFDWVTGQEPTRAAIQTLKAAFAAGPIAPGGSANPDGLPGVNLWVDTGSLTDPTASEDGAGPNTCGDGIDNGGEGSTDSADPDCLVGDNLGGGNAVGGGVGCLDAAFYVTKGGNFSGTRKWIFRYGISGDPVDNNPCLGGRGEIGGNDFIEYNHDAGTMMHELGHNLNLRHGGNVDANCKPDYVSVMNYDLQFAIPQAGGTAIIDYSPPRFPGGRGAAPLPTLSESALNESTILDATDATNRFVYVDPAGQKIQWQLSGQDIDGDGIVDGVDWNSNGLANESGLGVNIDTNAAGGGPARCANAFATSTLTGFHDWNNVSLPFRQFGDSANGALNPETEQEQTLDELFQIQEQLNTTDVAILKTADPDPVEVGDHLVYTLTVTNNGPNPASSVRVEDTLPERVSYVSDTAGCIEAPVDTLTCELGELLSLESRAVEITVDTDDVCVDGVPTPIKNVSGVQNAAPFAVELDPNNDSSTLTVTPVDTTPPEITSDLVVAPTSLAPPNHEMVTIQIPAIVAEDVCDSDPMIYCSVESDEPPDATGDGHTPFDIVFNGEQISAQGTGERLIDSVDGTGTFDLQLRAERDGSQDGRSYTISCVARDTQGNTSEPVVATVVVPHRSRGAK